MAQAEIDRILNECEALRIERDAARADQAELERLRAVEQAARTILTLGRAGGCREELASGEKCWKPAEFLLWGRLTPPEGVGPRCYGHAARHVGHRCDFGRPSFRTARREECAAARRSLSRIA